MAVFKCERRRLRVGVRAIAPGDFGAWTDTQIQAWDDLTNAGVRLVEAFEKPETIQDESAAPSTEYARAKAKVDAWVASQNRQDADSETATQTDIRTRLADALRAHAYLDEIGVDYAAEILLSLPDIAIVDREAVMQRVQDNNLRVPAAPTYHEQGSSND